MYDLIKIVEDIMQAGFDCAMGGDPFKSPEENKKIQEKKYEVEVARYKAVIQNMMVNREMEFVGIGLNSLAVRQQTKEDVFKLTVDVLTTINQDNFLTPGKPQELEEQKLGKIIQDYLNSLSRKGGGE
jgi:hypothetical protein